MANPIDLERAFEHGLGPNVKRAVRKFVRTEEKSWVEKHLASHKAANENDAATHAANENIGIPLQRILTEHLDQDSTLDAADETSRIVRDTVKQALHELLPADAMLYVSMEDFNRIHQDLQKQAEAYVKEAVGLASKLAKDASKNPKEIPVNKDSITRGLRRELASPKFKDRHYELLNAVSRAKLPPELGTARNV